MFLEVKREHQSPETGITSDCESLCVCWETDMGPLGFQARGLGCPYRDSKAARRKASCHNDSTLSRALGAPYAPTVILSLVYLSPCLESPKKRVLVKAFPRSDWPRGVTVQGCLECLLMHTECYHFLGRQAGRVI